MVGIRFEPVDTLFFRDGTPFTAASDAQEAVASVFPPAAETLIGALRAALARGRGWSGVGRWPDSFNPVLGDGPDDLGSLSFRGPVLVRGDEPLLPAPLHLRGRFDAAEDAWAPAALLRPGEPVCCDLGDQALLPAVPETCSDPATLKPATGSWLTARGFQAVLDGRLPTREQLVPADDLWVEEPRIGLKRDPARRTAEQGMLYSTRHVRLGAGVGLGLWVGGLPEEWTLPFGRLLALGGEGRMAACEPWDGRLSFEPPWDAIERSRRFVLVAVTCLDVDAAVLVGQRPLPGLAQVRVVSACSARPVRVGGWDSLRCEPRPLRSVWPAGSVLFCECDDPPSLRAAASEGWVQIGERRNWGYGWLAVGRWPDGLEANT